MVTLKELISTNMNEKQYSVKYLSKKTGVSKTVIYGLVRGNYWQPYFSSIMPLLIELDVTMEELKKVNLR